MRWISWPGQIGHNHAVASKTQDQPTFSLERLEDRLAMAGDVVLQWNSVALEAVRVESASPGTHMAGPTWSSRNLAMVHAAIYDAVNSIDQKYASYLVEALAPEGASAEAAAAQAAHDVLLALFPSQAAVFDAELVTSLAAVANGVSENDGVAVGRYVASAILAARANDHSGDPMSYTPGTDPGDWQPTPPSYMDGLSPAWGYVTPFVMTSSDQFGTIPPPELTSAEYAAAYEQVKSLGADTSTTRTDEQTEIGIFWAYDRPDLGTPPRLYNQIVQGIAVSQGNTMVENARLFALINIAQADAGIASWNSKYVYDFWRPITAIWEADTDGNPATVADPTWMPLGAPGGMTDNFTPPFPAYVSGHSTFGAAVFQTLANFYGRDDISFTATSEELPGVTRSYTSFSQAAEENGISRIYLGVHWIFDNTYGKAMGSEIANWTFEKSLGSVLTPNQGYVAQLYRDLLGREAENDGLYGWSALLDSGEISREQLVEGFLASDEYHTQQTYQFFAATLGRSPTPVELQQWLDSMGAGASVTVMEVHCLASEEYFQQQGGTSEGFVQSLYAKLLNRSLSDDGWMDTLSDGGFRDIVAGSILDSSEMATDQVESCYDRFLCRNASGQEITGWVDTRMDGMSADNLLVSILASDEYFSRF